MGEAMNKLTKNYDVLFLADHFVMVTTVETIPSVDNRDIEKAALIRLANEYGQEFADNVKSYSKKVSIEEIPGTSADESNKPQEQSDSLGGGA